MKETYTLGDKMECIEKQKRDLISCGYKDRDSILNSYIDLLQNDFISKKSPCINYRRRLLHSAPSCKMREKLVYLDEKCNIIKQPEKDKNTATTRPRTATVKQRSSVSETIQKPVKNNLYPAIERAWNSSQYIQGLLRTHSEYKSSLSLKDEKSQENRLPFLTSEGRSETWSSGKFRQQGKAIKRRRQRSRKRHHASHDNGQTSFRRQSSESNDTENEDDISRRQRQARYRFYVSILCVRVLIRWLHVIIDISDSKTSRTATEEQWYTLHYSQEARELAFDKSLYSRERTCTKVPPWAVRILEMPPEDRTDDDCRKIHALLRGLKSFDKFTEKIQLYMCKSFKYHHVQAGRVILRKGHVGFNFYFIFSGSVFVNVDDISIDGKRFQKTVTTLNRGDSFGELALLQDIRRTASITCKETCELLYVDKETFAKVCPRIFEKELEEKEKFLTRLPLFSPKWWTKDMLKSLCTEAQILEYKTNKVVATDSDDEEWIYICMEGKCQIIRRLCLEDGISEERRETSQRRASTPELSDEILDILGKINPTDPEDDKDGDGEEPESETESDEGVKERLLESMALEYRGDGRRRKIIKSPDKEEDQQQKKEMSLKEHATLTSLMTQDLSEGDGKDYVYLNICLLQTEEVFDLYSILYPSRRPASSTVILVSAGAKLLRIKRKNFFTVLTYDALEHAKTFAKKNRYPTDKQLLESYKDKSRWEDYKYNLVQDIVSAQLKRKKNICTLTLHQVNMMKRRHQRALKLLTTLKRNTAKNEVLEKDSSEDEEEKKPEERPGDKPPPLIKLPDSEHIRKEQLKERRVSTVSGRTVERHVNKRRSTVHLKFEETIKEEEGSAIGTLQVPTNNEN